MSAKLYDRDDSNYRLPRSNRGRRRTSESKTVLTYNHVRRYTKHRVVFKNGVELLLSGFELRCVLWSVDSAIDKAVSDLIKADLGVNLRKNPIVGREVVQFRNAGSYVPQRRPHARHTGHRPGQSMRNAYRSAEKRRRQEAQRDLREELDSLHEDATFRALYLDTRPTRNLRSSRGARYNAWCEFARMDWDLQEHRQWLEDQEEWFREEDTDDYCALCFDKATARSSYCRRCQNLLLEIALADDIVFDNIVAWIDPQSPAYVDAYLSGQTILDEEEEWLREKEDRQLLEEECREYYDSLADDAYDRAITWYEFERFGRLEGLTKHHVPYVDNHRKVPGLLSSFAGWTIAELDTSLFADASMSADRQRERERAGRRRQKGSK